MRKHYRWVIIGGIIIFVLPLIGVPYAWKMIIQFVVGLGLILLGLIEKSMFVYTEPGEEPTFEESRGPINDEAQESMFESNDQKEAVQ